MKLPDSERTRFLLGVFVAYLALILIFGYFYYEAYKCHAEAFVFQAELLKTKNAEVRDDMVKRITDLREKQDALRQLHEKLSTQHQEVKLQNFVGDPLPLFVVELAPYRCEFSVGFSVSDSREQLQHGPDALEIFDSHHLVVREAIDIPRHPGPGQTLHFGTDDFDAVLPPMIEKFGAELGDQKKSLSKLGDTSSRNWSIWDFIYFSTITQTTVGYGDILPNSTLVRILVMIQVITALIGLAFVFNFIPPKQYKEHI